MATHADVRELFAQAASFAADFRDRVDDLPAGPTATFAEALRRFDAPTPETPSDPRAILADLVANADGALMMPAGPRFFGWVNGGSDPVGVSADMLTSAWGQNAGNYTGSPAAAASEAVAGRWLLDLLDLPRESSVGFASGATLANFSCLAAARGAVLRAAGWDPDLQGLFGAPEVTVVLGEEAHSTIFAALQYLGFGRERVVKVPTNEQGAIDPDAFASTMAGVAGPSIAILQAGQLNTGAFDDFDRLIPVAKAAGAWVHVDGAFGLWARATPARRQLTEGIELADSWGTDGHKWLQTPYDSGFAIVRDEVAHRRAMSLSASYLPSAGEGEHDPSAYVPELSKRARGFAVWAVLRALGRSGIADMVERHCRIAAEMARTLAAEPGIEVLNDVVLNQAVVRFGDDDDATKAVVARIQSDGVCFAGTAVWRGRTVMRLSVIGRATTLEDGVRSARAMIEAWRACR